MPSKFPYTTSVLMLNSVIDQLKRAFPPTLNAETLKKLGLAANNEGVIINVIRFLGLINDQNERTEKAQKVFTLHDTKEFQDAFSELVREAYRDLFALYGEAAWTVEYARLVSFFRQADQSTQRVGEQQARTFSGLAIQAGRNDAPQQPRKQVAPVSKGRAIKKVAPAKTVDVTTANPLLDDRKLLAPEANRAVLKEHMGQDIGLTVRIEINLPVSDNQETYDRIFKSIRENLLNG